MKKQAKSKGNSAFQEFTGKRAKKTPQYFFYLYYKNYPSK